MRILGTRIVSAGALVVAFHASNCTPRRTENSKDAAASTPYASDTLPVDALERSGAICDRLVAAGVAKGCVKAERTERPNGMRGPVAAVSTFEPVGGFPNDKCTIRVDFSEKEFKGYLETIQLARVPEDDFPRSFVFSTAAAMWHATVTCGANFEKATKWETCREKEKKPVAACAKAFPVEYAKYRALHDAAVRIVDGRP